MGDTCLRQTPSYIHCTIPVVMATSKTTCGLTINTPHTAITTMVQPLVEGMIFTFRTGQVTIAILISTVTHTHVQSVTIQAGFLETPITSTQVS